MNITLTAIFKKVPEGYIGYVEELPGANTQGDALDETRENLKEAVELVLRRIGSFQKKLSMARRYSWTACSDRMKLRDLVRHPERHECEKLREGGNHTVLR